MNDFFVSAGSRTTKGDGRSEETRGYTKGETSIGAAEESLHIWGGKIYQPVSQKGGKKVRTWGLLQWPTEKQKIQIKYEFFKL